MKLLDKSFSFNNIFDSDRIILAADDVTCLSCLTYNDEALTEVFRKLSIDLTESETELLKINSTKPAAKGCLVT